MSHEEVESVQAKLESELSPLYSDLDYINSGGTAHVWSLRRTSIGQRRVIKVLRPDVLIEASDFADISSQNPVEIFRSETKHILSISHPNVIKLYDAGQITSNGRALPWYIMEWVPGHAELEDYFLDLFSSNQLSRQVVVDALLQTSKAVGACHELEIVHCDLKPGNVIVSGDGQVRLTDLGFAKTVGAGVDTGVDFNGKTVWMADRSFICEELREIALECVEAGAPGSGNLAAVLDSRTFREHAYHFDLCALGRTIEHLLDTPATGVDAVLGEEASYLRNCVDDLTAAPTTRASKFSTIRDFHRALKRLEQGYSPRSLGQELNPSFGRTIALAGNRRFPRTPRLETLVDLPLVQRLRRVRQLGLTERVYPGATHSRFEHTLGTVERATEYLRALWGSQYNDVLRRHLREEDVSALVVAALVHDIGHYPLAHAFEEVEPGTEQLYHHTYLRERILNYDFDHLDHDLGVEKLENNLSRQWNINLNDVRAVLQNQRQLAENIQTELVSCLHSIIDGPLDADKLDYLKRDATHVGSPYASGIDEHRLLENLVPPSIESSGGIGIHANALDAAEGLYSARYHLFVTVYWHHANRSMERMVSEAVRILRRRMGKNEFEEWFYRTAFASTERELLASIYRQLKSQGLDVCATDLIKPLLPPETERLPHYRRICTIARIPGKTTTHEHVTELFDHYMTNVDEGEAKYKLFEGQLRRQLLDQVDCLEHPHRILVDVPDPRVEREEERRFDVWEVDQQEGWRSFPVGERSALFDQFADNWRQNARKVRILAHHSLIENLQEQEEEIRSRVARIAQDVCHRSVRPQEAKEVWDDLGGWW